MFAFIIVVLSLSALLGALGMCGGAMIASVDRETAPGLVFGALGLVWLVANALALVFLVQRGLGCGG